METHTCTVGLLKAQVCAEVRDGRDVRERLGWTWGTAVKVCGGILWCMGRGGPGEREYVCVCVLSERCRVTGEGICALY